MNLTYLRRLWLTDGILFVACFIGAGAYSLFRGQDANWDLKNYHLYIPYAYINDRLNFDVAPASLLTFFNPVLDLPFYYLIRWLNDIPELVSFLMAVPTAIAIYFLYKVLLAIFGKECQNRVTFVLVSFGFGISGAAGIALWGTTMNEWSLAALDMISVYIIVCAIKSKRLSMGAVMASGFLAGVAAGLKLTAATYCVGIFVAILSLDNKFLANSKLAFYFGIAVVVGLLAASGAWMITLYKNFDNPLFPLFNDIFRSSWWAPNRFMLDTYVPKTWQDAALFPLQMLQKNHIASEVAFRDWHLPYLYITAFLAMGKVLADKLFSASGAEASRVGRLERFLITYLFVSYVVWFGLHATYRYQIQIELVSGCVLVVLWRNIFAKIIIKPLVITLFVVLVLTKLNPSWGRIEFGSRFFDVHVPELPSDSLVIFPSGEPLAYLIPFFPPSVRFVSINNSLIRPGMDCLLNRRIESLIRNQHGSIYVVDVSRPVNADLLKSFGLIVDGERCQLIDSNLDPKGISICEAARTDN